MSLLNKLFSKKKNIEPVSETPMKRTNFTMKATVIDEDGESHELPENAVIAKNDNTHCFTCNSEYYHFWIGCYFLKKESENYSKPIYFKKIKDLEKPNTCSICFDYATGDDYIEWDLDKW